MLGPEYQLARDNEADHLLISFERDHDGTKVIYSEEPRQEPSCAQVTLYFACIGKGQVRMPVSLKLLQHRMKKSKVNQINKIQNYSSKLIFW